MLARKYRGIGPLLTKVEGLVVHTNTGKSPKLRNYYAHWEKKIFEALTKVCVNYKFIFMNFKILKIVCIAITLILYQFLFITYYIISECCMVNCLLFWKHAIIP